LEKVFNRKALSFNVCLYQDVQLVVAWHHRDGSYNRKMSDTNTNQRKPPPGCKADLEEDVLHGRAKYRNQYTDVEYDVDDYEEGDDWFITIWKNASSTEVRRVPKEQMWKELNCFYTAP
jgi:hypothetical protein